MMLMDHTLDLFAPSAAPHHSASASSVADPLAPLPFDPVQSFLTEFDAPLITGSLGASAVGGNKAAPATPPLTSVNASAAAAATAAHSSLLLFSPAGSHTRDDSAAPMMPLPLWSVPAVALPPPMVPPAADPMAALMSLPPLLPAVNGTGKPMLPLPPSVTSAAAAPVPHSPDWSSPPHSPELSNRTSDSDSEHSGRGRARVHSNHKQHANASKKKHHSVSSNNNNSNQTTNNNRKGKSATPPPPPLEPQSPTPLPLIASAASAYAIAQPHAHAVTAAAAAAAVAAAKLEPPVTVANLLTGPALPPLLPAAGSPPALSANAKPGVTGPAVSRAKASSAGAASPLDSAVAGLGPNGLPETEEVRRRRLARKAELARKNRRDKKRKLSELELENAELKRQLDDATHHLNAALHAQHASAAKANAAAAAAAAAPAPAPTPAASSPDNRWVDESEAARGVVQSLVGIGANAAAAGVPSAAKRVRKDASLSSSSSGSSGSDSDSDMTTPSASASVSVFGIASPAESKRVSIAVENLLGVWAHNTAATQSALRTIEHAATGSSVAVQFVQWLMSIEQPNASAAVPPGSAPAAPRLNAVWKRVFVDEVGVTPQQLSTLLALQSALASTVAADAAAMNSALAMAHTATGAVDALHVTGTYPDVSRAYTALALGLARRSRAVSVTLQALQNVLSSEQLAKLIRCAAVTFPASPTSSPASAPASHSPVSLAP